MVFIGIDPGKHGGIAYIGEDGYYTYPLTNEKLKEVLYNICTETTDIICCLEKVHAMPHQGVTSMFTFGEGYGYIKGFLEAYEIPYQLVPPNKWKKEFSLNDDKQNSIDTCKQLFPNIDLLPTPRHTKPHDGMAEALLLALYGKRNF